MVLLLILGVTLAGLSFGLVIHALGLTRMRAADRLSDIAQYGYPSVAEGEDQPGGLAAQLDRLAAHLGGAAMPRMADGDSEIRGLLLSAGAYGTSPTTFVGYRLLCAIVLPVAWLWFGGTLGASTGPLLIATVVVGLLAWRLPLVLLTRRADQRLSEIDLELPELIDSLVVTVEAGLGLNAAMKLAASELQGPLGEEIGLALREQSMGLSADEALENLGDRVDTASMRAFVRAVLQGERLGVSIGDIMRSLAVEARGRRRASAEERAQRAPVKMLFPLVFLIFPAMLIVLLYPGIHNIIQVLGSG
jgi:tight adherence protein C